MVLISFCFNAQTNRFIYELQFKRDSTQTQLDKLNFVLDVNPKDVKFYEYYYLESDSINKVHGNYENQYGGEFQTLKRERNSFKNRNYELINFDMFTYTTEDKINWKLSDETKKIGDYTLQKATADFGGRSWTAWFNKEINISEESLQIQWFAGIDF
ncbi:GLPGLI family protein [Chryseobacterium wanjuense]